MNHHKTFTQFGFLALGSITIFLKEILIFIFNGILKKAFNAKKKLLIEMVLLLI